jgi:hypothetical protein
MRDRQPLEFKDLGIQSPTAHQLSGRKRMGERG